MHSQNCAATRLGALADRVIPEIEAAIEEVVAQPGPWTKPRADTLNSLNRLLNSFLEYSRSAAEKKRLSEENEQDVAYVLAAIDNRIAELARAFAGELGGEASDAPAGAPDRPRMGDVRAAGTISGRDGQG
jgi:membrane-bound lytic murein transglycosylase MltF